MKNFNLRPHTFLIEAFLRLKSDIFLYSSSRRIEWCIETPIFLNFNSENQKTQKKKSVRIPHVKTQDLTSFL